MVIHSHILSAPILGRIHCENMATMGAFIWTSNESLLLNLSVSLSCVEDYPMTTVKISGKEGVLGIVRFPSTQ